MQGIAAEWPRKTRKGTKTAAGADAPGTLDFRPTFSCLFVFFVAILSSSLATVSEKAPRAGG
jgi:hypothetical protein